MSRDMHLPAVDAIQFPLQSVSYNHQLILCNRLRNRRVPKPAAATATTDNSRRCTISCRGRALAQLLLENLDALRVPAASRARANINTEIGSQLKGQAASSPPHNVAVLLQRVLPRGVHNGEEGRFAIGDEVSKG